jgi:hypothetical protein
LLLLHGSGYTILLGWAVDPLLSWPGHGKSSAHIL